MRIGQLFITFLLIAIATGCQTMKPIHTVDNVDLNRFMGDWYVIGSIPVTLPFFSEEGAHNAVESYELREDGTILTTYSFRKGSFDGKKVEFTPKGRVYNAPTNTEWRMQFVWPFKADYRIVYVDEAYSQTIIGRVQRDYVWLMARSPKIPEADYQRLLEIIADEGYDISKVRKVPQRWD